MKKKDPIRRVGIALLIFSLAVFLLGYVIQYGCGLSLVTLAEDFYANISSELVSIAITILIIDYLSERRAETRLRQQLVREMGSIENSFAIKAAKELRAHGWLIDGSLKGADFGAANLQGADLSNAKLHGVTLSATNLNRAYLVNASLVGAVINGANLENADLSNVNFTDADLRWSDLSNADLRGSNLTRTNLEGVALDGANVSMEQLRQARSLKDVIMPDGNQKE